MGLPISQNGPTCKFRFINHVKNATRKNHLLDPFLTSHNFSLSVKVEHLDSISDHDMLMVYVDENPEDNFIKSLKQTLKIYKYEEADKAELQYELNKMANEFYIDMKHEFTTTC